MAVIGLGAQEEPMAQVNDILEEADNHFEASVERLMDFLRIPSISTDHAYESQCRAAALWTKDLLAGMGFSVRCAETPAHPVVIGHYEPDHIDSSTPHILLYGHYDVQPPDPIELWKTPPFEPSRRKDNSGIERIYARGACDDKGQLMTILEASRAWLKKHGRLPFRATVLIEGDEESDCSHLDSFLKHHRRELSADMAFVCDTGMWDDRTPAITTRLRGCVCDEVTITGAKADVHSGFGSAAANPIHILSDILADMRDKRGRIRLPGFYDGVRRVPRRDLQEWRKLKHADRRFLRDLGLSMSHGERGYTLLEQIWARPTCEVNGIIGGYTGEGGKTVIPSEAHAKLSFRLVGDQDPVKVRAAFRRFVKARVPKDCQVRFNGTGGEAPAVELSTRHPHIVRAAAALAAEWKRQPVFIGSGGSIPIVGSFKRVLGMDSLMVGFSLNDDGAHSPNEKYDLHSYRGGIRSWIRIFDAVASPDRS
jgi:acetylornithine deacetylase/succinyl-diaminopimelate desuccinylase-like protein